MSTSAHNKTFKFWHDVLPHVTKRRKAIVRERYGGQTIGVDAQALLWEYPSTMDEVAHAIGHRLSYYEPTKMMRMFERIHERLLLQNIFPIYVFGGQRNPSVRPFLGESLAYDQLYRFHLIHGVSSLENPTPPKLRELRLAAQLIRKLRDADPKLPRFLANWMQSLGMEVVGAPFESHWQLVEMERNGRTSGTMSYHMNVVIAGGQQVMVKPNFRELMRSAVYDSSKDLQNKAWTYDFTGYVDYLPEFAALYGTAYNFRSDGWTTKNLFHRRFRELVEAIRNGEDYWAQQEGPSKEFISEYHRAKHQFRYGPVWREKNGEYTIEPLNPIPEGFTWEDLIGFDPIHELTVEQHDYQRAVNFDGRTFLNEAATNVWYVGIFPKMRVDQDDLQDNDESFVEFLDRWQPGKPKVKVTRPAPQLKEPEIGW